MTGSSEHPGFAMLVVVAILAMLTILLAT